MPEPDRKVLLIVGGILGLGALLLVILLPMSFVTLEYYEGAIPVYNTRELVSQRSNIEKLLYKTIRERLGGVCCRPDCDAYSLACPPKCTPVSDCKDKQKGLFVDVKFFQLTEVDIPSDVEDRFMEALVLKEKNLREKLYQNATVIRKETNALVKSVGNEAIEIQQNAYAQSEKIATVSRADYTNTIETARSSGLKQLYTALGISSQEHKNSFDYLRTLRGLDNVHLTVDFQQRIAGNL